MRFAFIALVAAVLCAQGGENVAKNVRSVQITGYPAHVELETRAGQPLDNGKLQRDLKKIWAAGTFDDVKVESSEVPEGVNIIFRITRRPSYKLRKVQMEPNTPEFKVSLEPETRIDEVIAQQLAGEGRRQLVGQGYADARVEASLVPVDNGYADLILKLNKGPVSVIKEVGFVGDLGLKPGQLHKALAATKVKTMLPGIPGIWSGWKLRPGYSEDAMLTDAGNVRAYLLRRGYFDAKVRLNSLTQEAGKAHLLYRVDAGPLYAFRKVDVHGADGDTAIQPGRDARLPGDDLCRTLIAERRKAEKTGVLDFTAKLELSDAPAAQAFAPGTPARRWADLSATFERGKRYRVGRIEFRGNHSISDITVRRAAVLDEGRPLDQMLLRKTLLRINRMGYFEPLSQADVHVNTPPDSDEASLVISLKEKKTGHWALSGPVGPMSIAGPLQFAIGKRLPPWGRNVFELSTYTASVSFMAFASPMGRLMGLQGILPSKSYLMLGVLQRPVLPGQKLLSGFTISPQLGWQAMLLGYGVSHARDMFGGMLEGERAITPPLPVTVTRAGESNASYEGMLSCELPKKPWDRVRQVTGITMNMVFSLTPF